MIFLLLNIYITQQSFIYGQFKNDLHTNDLNLYEVYHNTDDRIPIICGFVNVDVDPSREIYSLAQEIGLPENIITIVPLIRTRVSNL